MGGPATVALSHQPLSFPLLAQFGGLAYVISSSVSFNGCTITNCSSTSSSYLVRACPAPQGARRPRAA